MTVRLSLTGAMDSSAMFLLETAHSSFSSRRTARTRRVIVSVSGEDADDVGAALDLGMEPFDRVEAAYGPRRRRAVEGLAHPSRLRSVGPLYDRPRAIRGAYGRPGSGRHRGSENDEHVLHGRSHGQSNRGAPVETWIAGSNPGGLNLRRDASRRRGLPHESGRYVGTRHAFCIRANPGLRRRHVFRGSQTGNDGARQWKGCHPVC